MTLWFLLFVMHKWKTIEVNKKDNAAFEYFVEQFSDIKFAVPNSGMGRSNA
jgi:hypothetical protein